MDRRVALIVGLHLSPLLLWSRLTAGKTRECVYQRAFESQKHASGNDRGR